MSKSSKKSGATKAPATKKSTKDKAPKDGVVAEAAPKPMAPVEPHAAPAAPKAGKALSCLDAAAKVLAAKGEPMRAKDIIDAVFARKLWHSDAPTPAATLVSAILREMKKGDASRFKKAGRGLFGLSNANGK